MQISLSLRSYFLNAKIAQLVERHLAKVEVAGSNPVFRSEKTLPASVFLFPQVPESSSGGPVPIAIGIGR